MGASLRGILFRRKYPAWWAEWNRQLLRFINRIHIYLWLMDDRYPSTDDEQAVHLDFAGPEGAELNRLLPLVKWLLAIPHYAALMALGFAALACVIAAWFAILISGRYPPGLFRFVAGVLRWTNRVTAYAILLVTDRYPPLRLAA